MEVIGYTCNLKIQNPFGLNNFSSINGTHFDGMTNEDVLHITSFFPSTSKNFPKIICEKFLNAIRIDIDTVGIENLDKDSFQNCRNLKTLNFLNNNLTEFDKRTFLENVELQYLYLVNNGLSFIPKDAFHNQQKLITLHLHRNNISQLGSVFNNLINLKELSLSFNAISSFDKSWFKNLGNLENLYLNDNLIEELYHDTFGLMPNLRNLWLHRNKLKIIKAESFGILPNLTMISVHSNKIDAVDEKFIDNTGVQNLDMRNNICANKNITDVSVLRESMKAALEICFENYRMLFPDLTTTTLPPGCIGGNMDERVCEIEVLNQELRDDVDILIIRNQNLEKQLTEQNSKISSIQNENEDMKEKIDIILNEKDVMNVRMENQIKHFNAAIEELQNQILELSSRPCACR